MTLAITNILLLSAALLYIFAFLNKKEPLRTEGLLKTLRVSPQHLGSHAPLVLFLTFLLFLFLPLSIGLSFFLKSDANVVVVIVWILWTYNWTKYTFWRE